VRDRLIAAAGALPEVDLSMSAAAARAAVYRHGGRAIADAVLRRQAAGSAGEGDARRLLAIAEDWVAPRMPVGGRDLARLGIAPGPETGRLLKAFEAAWIADDCPSQGHADRLAALIGAQPGRSSPATPGR
jgi:poly(A) polymerase